MTEIKIKYKVIRIIKYILTEGSDEEFNLFIETIKIFEKKNYSKKEKECISKITELPSYRPCNKIRLMLVIQTINNMDCCEVYKDIIDIFQI